MTTATRTDVARLFRTYRAKIHGYQALVQHGTVRREDVDFYRRMVSDYQNMLMGAREMLNEIRGAHA
jgi:hypothetical protein